MNNNLIQVLWVEDDPLITQAYPLEAARYNIQLVPFSCWEDAEKALKTDFKRWFAIILDAKCKYKRDSLDDASEFLGNAMHAIDTICGQRLRILPWYVLSGGSEDELNNKIIDSRKAWDGDWKQKKYYSKATDRDLLFQRISYHASRFLETQIRLVYYPDVFKAIQNSNLDKDVEVYLEDLLLPIHSDKNVDKNYNDNMTKIRKCIELIFQSMAQNGILPNKKIDDKYIMHDILTDKRGGINNTWCSLIISGKNVGSNEKLLVSSKKNIIPNVLKDSFKNLIEIAAAYEHAENKNTKEELKANSRHTGEFLASINNAPYLLRGMTMELCNIILWYDNYISEHNDEEMNALEWDVIDTNKSR